MTAIDDSERRFVDRLQNGNGQDGPDLALEAPGSGRGAVAFGAHWGARWGAQKGR